MLICSNLIVIIMNFPVMCTYVWLYTELVNSLSVMLNVSMELWQTGTTKIFIRTELNEKLENLLWLRYTSASRMIQRCHRLCRMKSLAVKIQKTFRMHAARKAFQRKRSMTVKIQSLLKMQRIKQLYRHFVRIIIKIQSLYRGRRCRLQYRSLRNPYRRLSYEELSALYNELEASLEQHMAQQDFAQCDDIQYKLNEVKLTRSQFYASAELILPLSRKEIEYYLIELKYAYNYSKLHYTDNITALLLQQIQNLEQEKGRYSTVEELTALLAAGRRELETAMAKKEFKKCSELRDRIQKLENSLEIAVFTGE